MLIGEHKHSLDAKNRLAIPAKFRKELGDGAVLTRGLDGCLFIFTKERWEKWAEDNQNNRLLARYFFSGAVEVEFDSLGRVLVPEYLKKHAELRKEVVVAGLHSRLEVWDSERWDKYRTNLENKSDAIAEKLGELGVI